MSKVSFQVDALVRAKRRIGLRMVLVYAVLYAVFVLSHVFFPSFPGRDWDGISWGVLAGVALMVVSVAMAVLYHLLCSRIEREFRP
ncbi:MAG: DUF485 domain-containing protein [Desulfuromonadaceae bacterium]|nr:DUF485 domain-containing protein [Desulfuromonadaceae bacterium]